MAHIRYRFVQISLFWFHSPCDEVGAKTRERAADYTGDEQKGEVGDYRKGLCDDDRGDDLSDIVRDCAEDTAYGYLPLGHYRTDEEHRQVAEQTAAEAVEEGHHLTSEDRAEGHSAKEYGDCIGRGEGEHGVDGHDICKTELYAGDGDRERYLRFEREYR